MTEDREFYAETVQEAVEKAAGELGLPAQELTYRVLDEGSTGFLGIGARDARVVVETVPSSSPPAQPVASPEDEPPDDPLDDDSAMESVEAEPEDVPPADAGTDRDH